MSYQPLPPSTIRILDYLRIHYYEKLEHSSQTSSHWEQFGRFQYLEKTHGQYRPSGIGFGDCTPRTWYNTILKLPTRLYLRKMLAEATPASMKMAEHLMAETGRLMSYDMARMVLTSDLLADHLGSLNDKRVVIIGDGYGSLGTLLKRLHPDCRILYINLGRTLAFDAFYSGLSAPSCKHKLLTAADPALSEDFSYLPAELATGIPVAADIFINIASMQEMDPSTIDGYFRLIRSQACEIAFYCCNRAEKTLPDGTVTRFHEYDWQTDDEILLDGLCPWHQQAPLNRPPFVRPFDGPIHHRLVKIRPAASRG